ncbi:NACHT domain-containing protein [Streptomyces ipomoeae]|nr:NACHT domain-containing protein [Streptomyces ipomoeae]MDX2698684.1 NACHT domain-containing protein [Streptomyces ipomoeae]MDX2844340.1 NACHT domain-containing protein [Streptomyces ipomoeae]
MEADEPLWNAFVTVLANDGHIIGGGIYAHCGDPERPTLLTCAHVVNLALGRNEFTVESPSQAEVTLEFPAVPGVRIKARVGRWWPASGLTDPNTPPVRGRDGRWAADIAELKPMMPLPTELQPVPLAVPELGDTLWAWRGNGDPRTIVRLRANGAAGEWLVLEAPPTGFAVQPGYSGGPLWDRKRAAVVGLMVSAHERVAYSNMTTAVPIRQSYGIRSDVLRERLLGKQDPRGRLDPRIWRLLKAQQQAAVSFPYRSVGLHRDDLTQVYVRQQLAANAEPQDRSHTAQEAAQAEDERPPRTVEDFLARFRHVLVVGSPGTGKSTLTLQLSAELVRIPGLRQGQATHLVPIRVPARDLANRPEGELTAAISASARAAVSARLHIDIGEDLCVRPAGELAWLLIIDGLDEVEDATARADLSDRLRRFMDIETKHRLLITTRQLPSRESTRWQARRDLGRCEIEPFERGQRRDFVRRWFRNQPSLADDFLTQISTARLEEVVSVPLLATVAAIVFEERAGQPLPQTAFALYQRFVSHLYESRLEQLTTNLRARLAGWAEADHIMERLVTGRIDLLEHSAAAWLRGAEILPAALEWLRTANSQPYPQPTDWPDVVAAVLTSTGLVIHDGTNLTFVHRSFAEHLASAGAARRLPARFDADNPKWWHTLRGALTGGRPQDHEVVLHRALLSDTGDLLDWLLAGDDKARELGARLIFEGVPSTPAQHEALTETLNYWVSRVRRSDMWLDQLVRVIDTVRIAPDPVADLLVDMLDGSRHPLELRDAAIRALLRAGSATSEAVRALVAIMDERPLTGAQRVRAAEMLMDLGAEARAAARAGLLRISGERNWVNSGVRERATKLIEEIDASAPSREAQGVQAPRNGADLGSSEAWAYSTLVPGNRPAARPGALAEWNNIVQTYEPVALDLGATEPLGPRGTVGLNGSVSATADRRESGTRGHVLYPKVRAALGLPQVGTLDPATTAAAVYSAIWAAITAPGPPGADRDPLLPQDVILHPGVNITSGQSPAGPDLSEEQWDAVARWLCAHPEAHVPATTEVSFDVREVIASATPSRVHALAAALIHGPQSTARRAYELLARRILSQTAIEVPLQLLRIATEGARLPVNQATAEPVVAAICAKLRQSEYRHTSALVRTARTMGSDLFAARLVSDRSSDPRGTVRALLSLSDDHVPDAIRFLAAQVHGPLGGFSEWCAAIRLLRRLPQATSPVVRLVREVIEAAHDPEQILELCRVLIDYSALDAATEYLLELAQDASAETEERRKAIELLPRGEGHEECADRAHVVMAELTADASPAERVTLAETLRHIDPRGCRSATTLISSTLDDVTLPSGARRQALALLAVLGPDVRRQLVADLEKLHARPTDSDADRLTILRSVSEWGPDLHRAAQGIWERLAQRRTGIERVAMAAELHKWGWTSESRSSRLLTRIARSAGEEPRVRVAAAHALLRHGAGMSRTSGEVLHQLVSKSQISPALALQTARDLAATGGLLEARRVLSELILDAKVPDSLRYKAATVLLMVDLTCSPGTLATLRHMTTDRSLSEHTRNWATYAVDCARGGIHTPDGPPPGSWLRS